MVAALSARTAGDGADETGSQEIDLCTAIGRALHGYGTSALRLEQRLEQLSRALGIPGEFFVTPTAIFASYRIPGKNRPHTQLERVEPGSINLGRLADVEAVLDQVCESGLTVTAAQRRVEVIVGMPQRHSGRRVAAAAAVAGAAAVMLGGGLPETSLAVVMGALTGSLELLASRRVNARRLLPPALAAVAAFAAIALGWAIPGFSVLTAQVASVILLVPGFEFTVAIKEIATANLVSGAARLTSALGDFLGLGFGLAIGTRIAGAALGQVDGAAPSTPTAWLAAAAVAVIAFGFAGRLRAHRRDIPLVALACVLAFVGSLAGAFLLGPQLGAFVGALAVGLGSNASSRLLHRSPLLMMVPGIILLVPGSIGFRSFEMLLRHDVVSGIETAFAMALTATALTTGLLLANLLLPSEAAEGERS